MASTAAEQKAQKEATENALRAAVDALLDIGDDLQDEKDELGKRIAANRETLRNYVTMGVTTDDQSAAIDELYPRRAVKGEGEGEAEQPAQS